MHPQRQHRAILQCVGFLIARDQIDHLPKQFGTGVTITAIDSADREVVTQISTERALLNMSQGCTGFLEAAEAHQHSGAQGMKRSQQLRWWRADLVIKQFKRLSEALVTIMQLGKMQPDAGRQRRIHRIRQQRPEQRLRFIGHAVVSIKRPQQDLSLLSLGGQGAGFQRHQRFTHGGKPVLLVVLEQDRAVTRVGDLMWLINSCRRYRTR